MIQGSSVRLVIQKGSGPPAAATRARPRAMVKPSPPRFEDAFVDLLGGGAEGRRIAARRPAASTAGRRPEPGRRGRRG